MALSATLKRFVFLAALACAVFVVVDATQSMRRPANYNEPPVKVDTNPNPVVKTVHKRAGSKVQMGYYANWDIYNAADFVPSDVNIAAFTHILYAFAMIDSDTGAIVLSDPNADETMIFPGDDPSEPGNNLYGCLKQFYLLKLKQRNLKVLLSIGGGTYSQDGDFSFVTDATKRAAFVTSAVSMIENYGFDGIDLDFEYPNTTASGDGFASLLTSLRTAFGNLQATKGDSTPYELTAAVAAIEEGYEFFDFAAMDAALSYWNLMAYDYSGSWIAWTDDQANLYGGSRTGLSTDKAIKIYTAAGATASKITMGIPLYGHVFDGTAGLGDPYTTTGADTLPDNELPLAGATVYENLTDVSSYSYDPAKQELISYDTPTIATLKAQYVQTNGLAGSMFWEISQDKVGADSLISATANVYGTLDQTLNHINYPNSVYDNIKNNMGEGTTTSTTPTNTSSVSSASSSPTSTSGKCSTISAWSATATYVGGQQASYKGDLWTAQWWTLGDTPGGPAGVWVDDGAC